MHLQSNAILLLLDQSRAANWQIGALSPSSKAKLRDLATPSRRQQFLLGRWLIQQGAQQLLQRPVALDEISEGPHFPEISGVHASISHSQHWIGALLCREQRIGLDIEASTQARNYPKLACRAFHPDEAAWLASLPADAQKAAFYRIWTWREAAFKAGLRTSVIGQAPTPYLPAHARAAAPYWQDGENQDLTWCAVAARPFAIAVRKVDFPVQI